MENMELEKREERPPEQTEARKPNRCWAVRLDRDPQVIPPYCTCCGGATGETALLEYRPDDRKAGSRQEKLRLPLCPECAAHQKGLRRARRACFWAAVLVGLFSPLLDYLLILLPGGWEVYLAWTSFKQTVFFGLEQFVIGALLYLLLAYLVGFRPLEPRHSARDLSAWISARPEDGKQLEICFTHPGYARRFARENGAEAEEKPCHNPVEARSLLEQTARPGLMLLKVMGAMFAVALAMLAVAEVLSPFLS